MRFWSRKAAGSQELAKYPVLREDAIYEVRRELLEKLEACRHRPPPRASRDAIPAAVSGKSPARE